MSLHFNNRKNMAYGDLLPGGGRGRVSSVREPLIEARLARRRDCSGRRTSMSSELLMSAWHDTGCGRVAGSSLGIVRVAGHVACTHVACTHVACTFMSANKVGVAALSVPKSR